MRGAARIFHVLRGTMRLLGLEERRCAACREPFSPEAPDAEALPSAEDEMRRLFCPACLARLKRRTSGFCPYCGEPSAVEEAPCMPCGACLRALPPWSEFLFFGVYEGLLRELLLRAKFGGSLAVLDALGRTLAALCVEHYAVTARPDVVVPMPLDMIRLRERGFNQCGEMARHVAAALRTPMRLDLLVKVRTLTPQSLLNRERRRQLEQPFQTLNRADGLHVLLIDDICTTGATLDRAVTCLLAAGARRVDVAVLGRSSRHDPCGGGESSALP